MSTLIAESSLLGLAATISTWMGWSSVRLLRQRRLGGRRALRLAALLLKLIALLQQHRGLAAAALAGDPGFAGRLADNESRLATLLSEARRVADPASAERLVDIQRGWQQLLQAYRGWSVRDSFVAHTELLQHLLYLEEDLAEDAGLLDPDAAHPHSAALATRTLPQLMEAMGQLRAVSSAAAAAGQLDSVSAVRIDYLHQRSRQLIRHGEQAFRQAELAQREHWQALLQAWQAFETSLQQAVLGKSALEISAAQLFGQATAAIDAAQALALQLLQLLQGPIASSPATAQPALA